MNDRTKAALGCAWEILGIILSIWWTIEIIKYLRLHP